ncbi:LysR substrate-binding domain-containing protein [Sciscionella sediminilitoris]|uniref:LysR substrate-binding domain-containing protein n=1 Tax=Sciscionella sediminilitoris TaxID=1445613 RepID=UPI0004DF12D0|nr:LysR substrate-binding domain-containing protein [Sciscionella sp. SE31]
MAENLLDGRLKLRHLVLATTVAEHGSVVTAAEHLHITQPVVTRGIRELEELLGVSLFERTARGMSPTEHGTAFLEHADAILGEVRRAGKHLSELSAGATGTVTVGTHLAGSNVLLPRAIARLKRAHPGITVIVQEGSPELLRTELLSGELDLTVGRLSSVEADRTVRRALYREPIRLVARAGHPVTKSATPPPLAELLHYPWRVPIAQTTLRHELETALARHGLPLPADRIECTSILTMRSLLLETDVLAALPELVARGEEQLSLLGTELETTRTVGVTLADSTPPSPTARKLLGELDAVGSAIRAELA